MSDTCNLTLTRTVPLHDNGGYYGNPGNTSTR